jgi:hypothetical protein
MKRYDNGQFGPLEEKPYSKRNICVRLPEEETAKIEALGDGKSAWLRKVLIEAVNREL